MDGLDRQRVSSQTEQSQLPEQVSKSRKSSLAGGVAYLKAKVTNLFGKSDTSNNGVAQRTSTVFKSADIHNGEEVGHADHLSTEMQASAVRHRSEALTPREVSVGSVCQETLSQQSETKKSKNVKLIVDSLDKGDFRTVKKYLRGGSSVSFWSKPSNKDVDSLLRSVRHELATRKGELEGTDPKTNAWKKMENVLKTYDEISSTELKMEKGSKAVSSRENLQVALFIEHDIRDIGEEELPAIFHRSVDLPRAIAIDAEGSERGINILSRKKCSKIKGEGSFKSVKHAIRLPLENVGESAKLVVSAKSKRKTTRDRTETQREWNFINKLKDVGGVIRGFGICCYDKGKKGVGTAIQLEAMEGDLTDFSNRRGTKKLEHEQQISIASQMTKSVYDSHKLGIINWDLKLGNTLFREGKHGKIEVKISDFGLAFEEGERCRIHNSYGTEANSSPELVFKEKSTNIGGKANLEVCKKCEVWAMGVMLYNLHFDKPLTYPPEFLEYREEFDDFHDPAFIEAENLRRTKAYFEKHDKQVESPFKELTAKVERGEQLSDQEKYELSIFNMLRFDPEDRVSMKEAYESIKDL